MKEKPEKKKIRVGAVIFRIFLIVVAGLTVGLAVFSFNASHIGGNQLPMPFGYGASVVLSGSMEPTLAVNDLVFVKAEEDYDVGDVVVYQNGKSLIIHRIVKKDGEEFVTRGDANNADDDPINVSEIKGVMIFKIPFIGLIFKWLKTLPGTLIVLGLAIFFLYRSRRKEKDKDQEKLDVIVEEIRRLQALQNEQTPEEPKKEADAPAAKIEESPAQQKEETVSSEKKQDPPVKSDETAVENSDEDQAASKEQEDSDAPAEEQESSESSQDETKLAEKEQKPSASDDFADIDALISEIENESK